MFRSFVLAPVFEQDDVVGLLADKGDVDLSLGVVSVRSGAGDTGDADAKVRAGKGTHAPRHLKAIWGLTTLCAARVSARTPRTFCLMASE